MIGPHKFLIALSDRVFPPKPGTEDDEDERTKRVIQGFAIISFALLVVVYCAIEFNS